MLKMVCKRLLQAVPLVLLISIIVFLMIHLLPYDAIDGITTPDMSAERVALLKAKYGLDQPVYVQYVLWLKGILVGDFGYSIISNQSIQSALAARITASVQLVLPAYVTAFLGAYGLGLLAGNQHRKTSGKFLDGLFSILDAVPTYWLALLLIYFMGYRLNWFPIIGMRTVGVNTWPDFLAHFVLPYLVLALAFFPSLARYVRASTITELSQDYVLTQTSFGNPRWKIMLNHVSRNVLLPMITQLGMALPMLVTGAMITESIFGWPGVGPYFFNAIKGLDYPIIMIILLLSSTLVIAGNLLADILYAVADPRIKEARNSR